MRWLLELQMKLQGHVQFRTKQSESGSIHSNARPRPGWTAPDIGHGNRQPDSLAIAGVSVVVQRRADIFRDGTGIMIHAGRQDGDESGLLPWHGHPFSTLKRSRSPEGSAQCLVGRWAG